MLLDLRGLNCPLPEARTRKVPRRLAHGDRLNVECTDPLAVVDFPRLPRETGETLERREATHGLISYIPYQARKSMKAIFRRWAADAAGSGRR